LLRRKQQGHTKTELKKKNIYKRKVVGGLTEKRIRHTKKKKKKSHTFFSNFFLQIFIS